MVNITFMVGNGFDLNFGLKTSYKDFYETLKSNSKNRIISNILNSKNETNNLWSDMEYGLGKVLSQYSKDEVDAFIDDKIEIADLLTTYLKNQCGLFQITDSEKVSSSLTNRILSIKDRLPQKNRDFYQQIVKNTSESIYYSFICFNYTDTLDSIIGTLKENTNFSYHSFTSGVKISDYIVKPLHIHGELEKMMVLGVNDEFQIDNPDLQKNETIISDMVKSKANDGVGNYNTQEARTIIGNSRIIYVYGLSLGATDKMWAQELFQWLNGSANRLLIIDIYEEKYNTNCTSTVLKWKNNALNRIVKNTEIDEDLFAKVRDRVCLVANTNIFKIDGISVVDGNLKKVRDLSLI